MSHDAAIGDRKLQYYMFVIMMEGERPYPYAAMAVVLMSEMYLSWITFTIFVHIW